MPMVLTPYALSQQRAIYDAAMQYKRLNGYAPTFREIGDLVGMRSTSDVSLRLRQMAREGNVRYVERAPRTLVLVRRP